MAGEEGDGDAWGREEWMFATGAEEGGPRRSGEEARRVTRLTPRPQRHGERRGLCDVDAPARAPLAAAAHSSLPAAAAALGGGRRSRCDALAIVRASRASPSAARTPGPSGPLLRLARRRSSCCVAEAVAEARAR